MKKCEFDKNGICFALACYNSSQKCSARDKEGNPKYADTEEVKRSK